MYTIGCFSCLYITVLIGSRWRLCMIKTFLIINCIFPKKTRKHFFWHKLHILCKQKAFIFFCFYVLTFIIFCPHFIEAIDVCMMYVLPTGMLHNIFTIFLFGLRKWLQNAPCYFHWFLQLHTTESLLLICEFWRFWQVIKNNCLWQKIPIVIL